MIGIAPSWVSRYVGVPYTDGGEELVGADCFGLIQLVYLRQFLLDISYMAGNHRPEPRTRRAALALLRGRKRWHWRQVLEGELLLGDVALMRATACGGVGAHVGLVLNPEGDLLHTEEGINAGVCERRDLRVRDRILGFYRHPEMPG